MDRSWGIRVVAYALMTILAAVLLVPSIATWTGKDDRLPSWFTKRFTKKIQLGLDIQGGLHLVYEVQVDKAVSDKADRLAGEIEERLHKDKHVKDVHADRVGDAEINLTFKNPEDAKKVDRAFMREYQRQLFEDSRDAAAGVVHLKIESDYIDELRTYAVNQGILTISNRVNDLGVAEPSITRKGTDIVIELPGLKPEDFEQVKNRIGRTAQLEFKMVDDGTEYMKKIAAIASQKKAEFPGIEVAPDSWVEKDSREQHNDVYLRDKDRSEIERFLAQLAPEDKVPSDHVIGFEEMPARDELDAPAGTTDDKKVWRTYYLHRRAELTGEYLTDADVTFSRETNAPEVAYSLDREGANISEKLTGANIGRRMAIILDDKVMSAPTIQGRIGAHGQITLGASGDRGRANQEAQDLVAVLRTGALPAPLKKTFETQVGPTLGRDAVDKAKLSMIVGSLAVILFMLIYYRGSGIIADVAMILNILYQLAVLAVLGATLTLPGIAGVVLTVGMAVDANIIIYERIREELRSGKSVRGSVEAGFGRAFSAVVDAHVTAGVAGIVLYSYGTGPIRGFAVTLMIGIGANLFTSVWLSRSMFDFVVSKQRSSLSI